MKCSGCDDCGVKIGQRSENRTEFIRALLMYVSIMQC